LNQGFQLPVVYKRQKEVYQKNIELEQARKYLNKAELHLTIRQLAYRIMDIERRAKILDELENNYKEWRRIAQVQLSQGEIKKSVFNEIDFQFNQNRIQKEQLLADRAQLLFELKLLANSSEILVPLLEEVSSNLLSPLSLEKGLGQHPSIQFSNVLVEERKAQVLLNKSKLIPDVNLGYSNFSIIGWQTPDGVSQKYYGAGSRFGVYQFGLSLPLFNGSAKAKIKTAELDVQISQLEQNRQAALLNAQLSKLISKYQQAQKSYQYFHNEALPIANELYQEASVRLKNGDISFSEWNGLLGQSLQIKLALVSSIYEMQMAMAEYYYLTEKN
jgi:cobalt-zinc-cadmium resistance protein CzcA